MSILEETRPKMGDIALHNKAYSTVNEERQVVLDDAEDIHFKLQFAKVVTDKNDTPSILESNNVRDMNRSCGIVFSHRKTSEEIYKFLENKYFKREKSKQTLKSVPIMRVSKIDNKKMYGTWDNQHISKDFQNVFLEENVRERILQQLKRFEDKQWFVDRGIPRTLGILLHGTPGCGKTSVIKAIAAHFRRSIVIIDFKLVKTWKHLQLIFSQIMYHEEGEDHGRYSCWHDCCVYVFEDFDCMTQNFLERQNSDEQREEAKEERKKMRQMLSEHRKEIKKRMKRREEITKKIMASENSELKAAKNSVDILKTGEGSKTQGPITAEEAYSDFDYEDFDEEEEDRVTLFQFLGDFRRHY